MATRLLDLFRKARGGDNVVELGGASTREVDALRAQYSGLPLLEELDEETRTWLEPELEWFSIPGGWELFHQGDESDGLYIVKSGCLGIMVKGEEGPPVLVTQIHAGQTVGEMSLVSGLPRTGTVVAFRDSEVLRLSIECFESLVEKHPKILSHINRILVRRLARMSSLETPVDTSRTFALVPVSENVACSEFAHGLRDALKNMGIEACVLDSESETQSTEWYDNVERLNDIVLYQANANIDSWTRLCHRQADRILLVADPRDPPRDVLIGERRQGHEQMRPAEIVFLQPPEARQPLPVGHWLNHLNISAHWHARRGHGEDIARIARLISGRAISLILSGGGARGFAHLGAVRAIREAGIPIDLIGGTSMGAIIGGGVALEWPDDELSARLHRCFVETNPLSDITFPAIALFKGRKVSRLLRKEFEDIQIEDLWLSYFCMTVNLSKGFAHANRRGTLWRHLRASVAVPGLLPPMVEGGDLMGDGGVINNFPVDIAYVARRGPLVGVDVANYAPFGAVPPDYDSKSLFWLWRNRHRKIPGIVSLLMRAGTISGDMKARESARHLALYVEPRMPEVELRDWDAFDRAVEIGYQEACASLEQADLTALTAGV
jgi:NTE family protein